MKPNTLLLALLVVLPTVVDAAEQSPWKIWKQKSDQLCPSHHVNWIPDGGYLDFLDDFERRLPFLTRGHVRRTADILHRCADEKAGFGCEMAVSLETYLKLDLLNQFVAFGCQHYKCEEDSICERDPNFSTIGHETRCSADYGQGRECWEIN
jgi:hypothetical protein